MNTINNLGSNNTFLRPGFSSSERPQLTPQTQQAIQDAKLKLAEVLGSTSTPVQFDTHVKAPSKKTLTWGESLEKFVDEIDDKQKVAQVTTNEVLTGKSDNLHQSILATQEAGVAFTLLLEMRNKLVDGFKELMRMSI